MRLSNAIKYDGENFEMSRLRAGYANIRPSGTRTPLSIALVVTPRAKLPPALSPVTITLSGLMPRYCSAWVTIQ